MKYFILAGEPSGDLHSAALAEALAKADPGAEICGWGGDEMQKAGVEILKHYRELAFMGFVEVVKHLPTIFRNFRHARDQIRAFRPDALILIDYPGFNLRIAKWAKKVGFRVYYYISPQLWAWKEGRVKLVRKYIDRMYVILPFEKSFYARHHIEVDYVGHPLAWRIQHWDAQKDAEGRPELIMLPGSRKREIMDMLPVMLEAARGMEGYNFFIAGAPSQPPSLYYELISKSGLTNVTLTFGYTYSLLKSASAAFCTSGTATLETALFGVPQIVCYKSDRLSYLIAKRLIRVPFIGMVNLVSGKEVVPELIQDEFNPETLRNTINEILSPERLAKIRKDYSALRDLLSEGNPAERVATDVIQRTKSSAQ